MVLKSKSARNSGSNSRCSRKGLRWTAASTPIVFLLSVTFLCIQANAQDCLECTSNEDCEQAYAGNNATMGQFLECDTEKSICRDAEGGADLGCSCVLREDCFTGRCEGFILSEWVCVAKLDEGEVCKEDLDCKLGSCKRDIFRKFCNYEETMSPTDAPTSAPTYKATQGVRGTDTDTTNTNSDDGTTGDSNGDGNGNVNGGSSPSTSTSNASDDVDPVWIILAISLVIIFVIICVCFNRNRNSPGCPGCYCGDCDNNGCCCPCDLTL